MNISILGPCELRGPYGSVRLYARRQQIVLATLLWHSNRVVSVQALIDAVWGSSPPTTARTQIHIGVSESGAEIATALAAMVEQYPSRDRLRVQLKTVLRGRLGTGPK